MEIVVRGSAAGGGCDKKSAVCDRKQTFYDKKMPFRHPAGGVGWALAVRQCTIPPFFSGASNDPPPPTHRRFRYRFRRPGRLLRYDCSEERSLPSYGRLVDLQRTLKAGWLAVRKDYAEVRVALRSSEIE